MKKYKITKDRWAYDLAWILITCILFPVVLVTMLYDGDTFIDSYGGAIYCDTSDPDLINIIESSYTFSVDTMCGSL